MKYLFANNKTHVIQLPGRNGKMECFIKNQKKILDEWFKRYCPKHLTIIKVIKNNEEEKNINIMKSEPKKSEIRVSKEVSRINKAPVKKRKRKGVRVEYIEKTNTGNSNIFLSRRKLSKKIVGRASSTCSRDATKFSISRIAENSIAISNHIGVGIMSYNRLDSLVLLISSIRKYTDLNKTTIFISDESSDPKVWKWIKDQNDIIGFHSDRGGIAINGNRLLRCLSRFKYKIILNDDVEVLKDGWDEFYFKAMEKYNLKHFCYRQDGVYGAIRPDPKNGLIKINDKPHGAVLAIHEDAFSKVGYFDEQFGMYGIEHVDYSTRIANIVHQKPGFYDIANSDKYFRVYPDSTSDEMKSIHFKQAKAYFETIKDQNRGYINPTEASKVPGVSCIVPFRDLGRNACIATVINNIRAQRYPYIQIILVEQDAKSKINLKNFPCLEHVLVKNWKKGMHFCKSVAFNSGVFKSKFNKLILHDADMLVRSDYIKKMANLLNKYESAHIGKTVCYMDQDATDRIITNKFIKRKNISSDRIVGYYEGGSLGIIKKAYIRIGGFCEDFIGYGCEDTEFYYRMTNATKSFTERSIDLFHLWHNRTPGWEKMHNNNKSIENKIFNASINSVITKLNKYYINKYNKK